MELKNTNSLKISFDMELKSNNMHRGPTKKMFYNFSLVSVWGGVLTTNPNALKFLIYNDRKSFLNIPFTGFL